MRTAAADGLYSRYLPAISPAAYTALGIDAGPTTGICYAAWDQESLELLACLACECTDAMAEPMLLLILRSAYPRPRAAGIEKFVARNRSARLRGVTAAEVMGQVTGLQDLLAAAGVPVVTRPAADVKPWATDRRLELAGLLEPTEKFTDARDAARHALFTAVQAGMPDPLGVEAKAARARYGKNREG